MLKQIIEWSDWLLSYTNLAHQYIVIIRYIGLSALVLLFSYIADRITRSILMRSLTKFIESSETQWDDILLQKNVFSRVAHFVPALVLYFAIEHGMQEFPTLAGMLHKLIYSYMIYLLLRVINALLDGFHEIYQTTPMAKDQPIKGYIQTVKIIVIFIGIILILSILLDKSPKYFFTGLGALTAVLMLVFKDAILGFVASIQLSTNNMVRIGDSIELPKYGVEGEVIEISLTTIKVRNTDQTIMTIPPYVLVSDSFKNWRGMLESDGRRIKRAINININSIKFCDEQMLKRMSNIKLAANYIEKKKGEGKISELTNLSIFRAYLEAWLLTHDKLNLNMPNVVRTLDPKESGLPLEVYVFSKEKKWADYEWVQAEVVDHIIAMVPQFELELFQNPSGMDVCRK